jgi:hypothetical protein
MDPARFAQLLSENVVLHSPLLVRGVEGRYKASRVLAMKLFTRSGHYVREDRLDGHTSFNYWSGSAGGHAIEAMELVVDDDRGLVAEHTMTLRPWPALMSLRREGYQALKNLLGPEYWSYTPGDPTTLP